jgi:hypothetical protein
LPVHVPLKDQIYLVFKKVLLLLISTLILSCNYPGKGSLGGWAFVVIPIHKSKFKLAVDSFRKAHPENVIPEKWQYDSDYWQKDGHDYLEGEVLYLNKGREEMFFFSYIPINEDREGASTTIALRSVFTNGAWHRKLDLDTEEQKRLSRRFRKEILAELESITNTEFRLETEKFEQPVDDDKNSGKTSDFELVIDTSKYSGVKKVLSLREKSDSIASVITHGKFNVANILVLEDLCEKVKTNDFTMQTFTTTVEDLFYGHMASFTDYYIAYPNSCLSAKLKLSMAEYMSAYAPEDRLHKNLDNKKRILEKAKRENMSLQQIGYLNELFDSINLH